MRLFDSHVHLSDKKFDDCREAVLQNLRAAGVEICIDVACDLRDTERTQKLADENEEIYTAFGMHPHYVCDMTNEMLMSLAEYMSRKKCVAVGEIGLDYYYDFSPRETQKIWFANQLELAQSENVPVILHIRDAFGDCMDILRAYGKNGINGVMHCFSGSYEIAKECLDLGMHIAFGGSLTFNNAHNLRDVAKKLPLDRLLIETDCPYLAPVPLRGKMNEPCNVLLVAKMLSELHNTTVEEVANITFDNAMMLFKIIS